MPRSLKINEDQRVAILGQMKGSEFTNLKYATHNTDEQQKAQDMLLSMKLDPTSLKLLETRWSVQKSDLWGKTEQTKRQKVLYQWFVQVILHFYVTYS